MKKYSPIQYILRFRNAISISKFLPTFSLFLAVSLLGFSQAQAEDKPLAVYFIGDSFLAAGGASHTHTEKLLEAAGVKARIESRIYGSTHMGGHLNTPADMQLLREGGFTHTIFVAGCRPGKHPSRRGMMEHYGKKIVETARQSGVVPIVFMHQESKKETALYDVMIGYHTAFAEANGILRAPAFPAWLNALKEKPELPMWAKDGAHQSELGAYMNACVFYSLLTGKSPEGNSYIAKGVTPDEAALLQKVAWETWKSTTQAKIEKTQMTPLAVTSVTATANDSVRVSFTGPIHSKTLQSGKWKIGKAEVADARISDSGNALILSAPTLSAGDHSLTLSGIEPCRPGLSTFSTEKAVSFTAEPPPSWQTTDIGNPIKPGIMDAKENALSLTAHAMGKIGHAPSDEVFFVHRTMDGDGEIVAKLTRIEETVLPYPYEIVGKYFQAANPKIPHPIKISGGAGLMLRANDSAGAPMFCLAQTATWAFGTPGKQGVRIMARLKEGEQTIPARKGGRGDGSADDDLPDNPDSKSVAIPAPVWLKIVRKGDVFERFNSADGTTWQSHGAETIPNAPKRLQTGLFAYSGDVFAEIQADFEAIQIRQ